MERITIRNRIYVNTAKTFYAIAACFILSCGGGGSDGTVTFPGGGGNTVSGTITTDTVYPTASGSTWTAITDGTGRIFVKGNSLSISGTCSRNVASVQITEATALFAADSATCDTLGNWTWTKVFTAATENDYSISVAPVAGDATVGAVSATKLVRVDDVAPNAPSITSPGVPPTYTQTGTNVVTISGTVVASAVRVTGPNSGDSNGSVAGLTLAGTNFSQSVTLSSGSSTAYSYVAYDLAGNASAAATLTISYSPSISLLIAGAISGGPIAGTASFSGEFSHMPIGMYTLDAGTNYQVQTGFNILVNQKRSEP